MYWHNDPYPKINQCGHIERMNELQNKYMKKGWIHQVDQVAEWTWWDPQNKTWQVEGNFELKQRWFKSLERYDII